MLRCLVLLLAVGGCDLAFGLVHPVMPPICGPYSQPEEVGFDPGLVDVHDFSLDATGAFGMVYARLGSAGPPAITPWAGPHAIKRSGDSWVQDVARDKVQLNAFMGGHIMPNGTVFAWNDLPTLQTNLLRFNGTIWVADVAEVLENDRDRSVHFGNSIDLQLGGGLIQKFAVEIRPPEVIGERGEVRIIRRDPNNEFWVVTGQANPLATTPEKLDINGGVLTADHEILVYTAKIRKEDVSRIFASRRDNDMYNPGVELIIEGTRNTDGFTEPWINEDCTELYFRSGDATYRTTTVAGP